MEIEVWSVGKTKFTADPEYQDPMIREVIDQRGDVDEVITDYTDGERSDISHDEYARVTGDVPGLVLFEGWLTGDRNAPPPAHIPGAVLVMRGVIALREAEIDMLTAERDGLRKALRAITLGIAEPSPKTVAENALNGRYFDPETDAGAWNMAGTNSFPGPEDDPSGSYE